MKGVVFLKIDKAAIVRTIVLVLSIINIALEMFGKRIIPIDNDLISQSVSLIILIASAVSAWWKNNSFTACARQADNYLKELRGGK